MVGVRMQESEKKKLLEKWYSKIVRREWTFPPQHEI
jgi:hypothetical protein